LKDRGAMVLASARGVGRAIDGSLASWLGRRDRDGVASRFPCADACSPITERVRAVNRCRET
jgi:hypothetical protein